MVALLSRGVDVQYAIGGETALSLAAKRYRVYIALAPSSFNSHRYRRGHVEIFNVLLPHFSHESAPSFLYDYISSITPPMTPNQSYFVPHIIQAAVARDADWLEYTTPSNDLTSCLHLAASRCLDVVFTCLLANGADYLLNTICGVDGLTPIQMAEAALVQSSGPDTTR